MRERMEKPRLHIYHIKLEWQYSLYNAGSNHTLNKEKVPPLSDEHQPLLRILTRDQDIQVQCRKTNLSKKITKHHDILICVGLGIITLRNFPTQSRATSTHQ